MKRSFLFLQGPCTPFFERLVQALKAQGHGIHKINFCAGDILYGTRQSTSWFNKTPGHLVDFLQDIYQRYGITDQVLFGDQRPVHQPAVQLAKRLGIRNHVLKRVTFGHAGLRWSAKGSITILCCRMILNGIGKLVGACQMIHSRLLSSRLLWIVQSMMWLTMWLACSIHCFFQDIKIMLGFQHPWSMQGISKG